MSAPSVTIRPDEAEHFGRLAKEWWDPKGSSAMLHKLNPVRLAYIRARIDEHWQDSADSRTPLAGKTALDVGCGAGLLCEPLARLGAQVTGVDAAAENIAAAMAHARGSRLDITYHAGELGELGLGQYDLVTCLEVIEHVADKPAFLAGLARHLAPGGMMVLSTPNRTPQSRLLLVEGAELLGLIPRGTHRWEDFVTPEELAPLLRECRLDMHNLQGLAFSPVTGLQLSEDTGLNYLCTAISAMDNPWS